MELGSRCWVIVVSNTGFAFCPEKQAFSFFYISVKEVKKEKNKATPRLYQIPWEEYCSSSSMWVEWFGHQLGWFDFTLL